RIDKRQGHWSVEPGDAVADPLLGNQPTDKLGEVKHLPIGKAAIRAERSRLTHNHVVMRLRDIPTPFVPITRDGLFDEKDAALLRHARHQMLWPLPHEAPSQMRKHN